MSALARYAVTSMVLIGLGAAVISWFLDASGRKGVLLAALIAYPVQLVAFRLLERAEQEAGRFFFWWGAGIAIRVTVLILVGLASFRLESVGPAALLLSLAGFFLLLVLIEPMFLNRGRTDIRTVA